MILNMGGGGGTGGAVAAISVTYPSGATCTCTKGAKTLTAKDTSGKYLFIVPETGTWTITSGSKTTTVTVSDGNVYTVNLANPTYIPTAFTARAVGVEGTSARAPTISSSGISLSASGMWSSGIATIGPVDLSSRSKIQVDGTWHCTGITGQIIWLCVWSSIGSVATQNILKSVTYSGLTPQAIPELDISNLTQTSAYVGFILSCDSGITCNVDFTEMVLS